MIEGPAGGTDGPTGVLGAEHLTEELCGLRFRVSHNAFLQTNTEMAERLYAIAGDLAELSGRERLFDLFCGIGTIGLSLASRTGEVWGLEGVPEAVADAEANAAINGIANARFVSADARTGIAPLVERAGKPDVVVVDPPRSGLSKKIVRRLCECGARRIVYVSCNPTTLAPNAAQIVESGYTLRRVKPVDMFPQTPHVECVAVFEKMSARGFGVAAGLEPEVAGALAERCAELGYGSMWSNDHPGALGLETLASFAEAAPGLELGVAVMALDRHEPAAINDQIDRLGLDRERLWLGIGAGFSAKPLTTMREAVAALREQVPGVRLVLAAMGPKMCRLAGAAYDGAFFNWMTPAFAAAARGNVEAGAREAGREAPPVLGYVRTAVGADAGERLAKEESFYRDLHDGYRNHFDRLGESEGTVGVAAADREEAQRALAAYEALDLTVVRGLASAKVEPMTALAEAAAPAPGGPV